MIMVYILPAWVEAMDSIQFWGLVAVEVDLLLDVGGFVFDICDDLAI